MALSHDVVSQFAKMVNKPEEKKEETIKGTFQLINGKEYVKLDGSNIYTPVTSTVEAENGDRVNVLLKDHAALLTSNITSPSARNKDVTALRDEVDEQGNVIKQMDNSITQHSNSIIQINNAINQQNDVINSHGNRIDAQDNIIQQHGNVIEQHSDDITSMNNTIVSQGNSINQMNNTITSQGNTITAHDNRITANENNITAQGNTIAAHGTTLETFNSDIRILNSAFVIENNVLKGLAQIVVNDLTTNHLNTTYANIDFSNIQMAAVTKLFTDSGIIKDLVVQEGKITGELVGVTIKGDLVEAGTLKADRLVVLGQNGLYYKLNIDGIDNISTSQATKFTLTTTEPSNWDTNYEDYYVIDNGQYKHVTGATAPTWSSSTYYKLSSTYESGLDGTNILAHSITADRIQVTDLVAFGATIGGYHIGQHSLYSGAKASVDNSTAGVFLGDDGQMAIGDNDNYIKFYKDQNNDYKLDISADSIKFGGSNQTIQEEMDEIRDEVTTFLQIESSNGLCFKDVLESTVLTVTVYAGVDIITNITDLINRFGNNTYLRWKYKSIGDQDYSVLPVSDTRISDDGFTLTLDPSDIDEQIIFICEVIIDETPPPPPPEPVDTEVKFYYPGEKTFDKSDMISTKVKLFSSENQSKNWYISFDIGERKTSDYESMATLFSCKNENGSPWPGIDFRYRSNSGSYFQSKYSQGTRNIYDAVTDIQINISKIKRVEYLKIGTNIYKRYSNNLEQIGNFSLWFEYANNYPSNLYFNGVAEFGCNSYYFAQNQRRFEGTLSNMLVEFISDEATIENYEDYI